MLTKSAATTLADREQHSDAFVTISAHTDMDRFGRGVTHAHVASQCRGEGIAHCDWAFQQSRPRIQPCACFHRTRQAWQPKMPSLSEPFACILLLDLRSDCFSSGKSLLENADIEEEDLYPVQGAVTHFKVLFTDGQCRQAWEDFAALPVAVCFGGDLIADKIMITIEASMIIILQHAFRIQEQEALLEEHHASHKSEGYRSLSSHERYKQVNHAAKSILRRSSHCRTQVARMEHEITEQLQQSPASVLVYSFSKMFIAICE